MESVLRDLRKINRVLQHENMWVDKSASDLPFNVLAEMLGAMLKVDLYIISKEGRILGYHDEFKVSNPRLTDYIQKRQLPSFYTDQLKHIESTSENIAFDSELTIFPVEEKVQFISGKTTIIPIFASGSRLGSVIMGRIEPIFSTSDLLLAEHAATVIGTELLHWQTEQIAQVNRERRNVQLALNSLSYSELQAIRAIFDNLDSLERIITASKIATEYGITRSVIVNAIRKLESAGIIDSRSLGMKGTFIKIKNQNIAETIRQELEKD